MRIEPLKLSLSAAAANTTGTVVNIGGYHGACVQVTGTFSADVTFFVSVDGVTFLEAYGKNIGDANHGFAKKVTAPAVIKFDELSGIQFLRVDVANYTSGAVTAAVVGVG